jgi:hypothetical protein
MTEEDTQNVINKEVAEYLTKLAAFNKRETDICIYCGKQVKSLRKVGRCVYASPCGCRVWQGNVPEAWRKNG